jgi:hypothetical protein
MMWIIFSQNSCVKFTVDIKKEIHGVDYTFIQLVIYEHSILPLSDVSYGI